MTRMIWDAAGTRFYENGIDRGVLYIDSQPGVPWNGLTSLTDDSTGGTSKSYYVDGEKYLNEISREEFQATLTAFTYPDQFEVCNGNSAVRPGILITKQKHVPFGLSYRTMIGSDTDSTYYRIHILYDLLASPASRTYKTFSDNVEVDDFSWALTSTPPVIDGYRRSSHIIIDTRIAESWFVSIVEDILYGSAGTNGRLPDLSELIDLIDTNNTLVVVDHGDGTFTITAPPTSLSMLDTSVYQVTWPTVVIIDADTFSVSS